MAQRIVGTKLLNQSAELIACQVVRDIRKNMSKARHAWLEQSASNSSVTQDAEALHNLRVEIRRLRVWLQQADNLVRTRSRSRKQLKRWAQGSNTGRDMEVMFGLLQQANPEIDSSSIDILLNQESKILKTLIAQKPLALKPVTRSKSRHAETMTFATWLADRLQNELAMTRPLFMEDDETLHKARIHIKHMRYLIEPVVSCGLDSAHTALIHLKALQTQLGDMHDLFVLRQRLPELMSQHLSDRLTNRLMGEGNHTRGIQQDFTAIRNELTLYLRWQTEQYAAAMSAWHDTATQKTDELERILNTLIGDLQNA